MNKIYQAPKTTTPIVYYERETQTHNAIIELLAMALFNDSMFRGVADIRWFELDHEARERWRAIALGKDELP